ncbi:MAG: hypothetical protein JNL66_08085 [Alphaproteobacteria bacterium]|nr:hypothetical protein [Alphaproteobacteria bacterium]
MPDYDPLTKREARLPVEAFAKRRVTAICRKCDRTTDVPLAYLIATGLIAPTMPLYIFERQLRCSGCDGRYACVIVEGPPAPPPKPKLRLAT